MAGAPAAGPAGRQALRSRLLELRKAIPQAYRQQADAAIARRLCEWLADLDPGVLALWWPLSGEPDLRGEFEALGRLGWTIALPRVTAAGAPLVFGRWRPGVAMIEQQYKVSVPEPFEPVVPTVVVAPCLGFDLRGWRLGYGGGYYDRTLAALTVPAAGAAYDACEARLQPEAHDRRLAAIVTESRLLRCR
ncbi:MAG TPA: 5-formyltetrahydrofolate cyclo-ligase [Burkholderiaceae bacterium]|nr:5-formyltetrahydrofolate cyclo-ligase [Burkholderiaceae bacterium]